MSLVPTDAFPTAALTALFQLNTIPFCSLQADPRILYTAYIPASHYSITEKLPLLVAIHGTSRRAQDRIKAWQAFAEEHKCAVLAPLFPALLGGGTDIDGYHYLGKPPILDSPAVRQAMAAKIEIENILSQIPFDNNQVRYDLLLLQMLEEIHIRWPGIDTKEIFLTGFSGGAQFAHRFLYLWPERVYAASIGAAGGITRLDENVDWPAGVKDLNVTFGKSIDMEELKKVSVQIVVGSEDTLANAERGRELIKGRIVGQEDAQDRLQLAKELATHWRSQGMRVDLEIVEGADHHMERVNPAVIPFIQKHIEDYRKK